MNRYAISRDRSFLLGVDSRVYIEGQGQCLTLVLPAIWKAEIGRIMV
jgi:hypothetical protein